MIPKTFVSQEKGKLLAYADEENRIQIWNKNVGYFINSFPRR